MADNEFNCTKVPFEFQVFVEGFILGLDDQKWAEMKSEHGEQKARKIIRAAIGKMDKNNLANMTPKGPVN